MAKVKPAPKPEPIPDPADELLKAAVKDWIKTKMSAVPVQQRASTLPGWLSLLMGPLTLIFQAVLAELLKSKA